MAAFYLKDNIDKFEAFKGQLPNQIFLPLNTGRFITRNKDPKGRFFNERPNESINLEDWIQFQIDEGNLAIQTDNVFTSTTFTIGGNTYPINTSLNTIINAILTQLTLSTISDKHYTFTVTIPVSTWTINHNLNKIPSVTLLDVSNIEIDASVNHVSSNQVIVTFSTPTAGSARLN